MVKRLGVLAEAMGFGLHVRTWEEPRNSDWPKLKRGRKIGGAGALTSPNVNGARSARTIPAIGRAGSISHTIKPAVAPIVGARMA